MEPSLPDLPTHPIQLRDLATRKATRFALAPDAAACSAIAMALGISGLRKLQFRGTLTPSGKQDWLLDAHLGATVAQPCVITLATVNTRIDENVRRHYMAELPQIEGTEVEIPEDDSLEPLPASLDLAQVMTEALALALPAFPRAPDAKLEAAVFTDPALAPMTDADARPFAGLGALRDALGKKADPDT
jgi:uncharacterized metal-binding protein YceD (DUF177 family)